MKPLIVAHRGASEDAPENTLAAFRLAWQQGADGVEMDLRLSQDGVVVVIHDADLLHVAGDKRRVDSLTAAQLAELRTGGAGQAGDVHVPTLREVLREVPAGKKVFLECKSGAEMLPILKQTLEDSPVMAEQVVLIGFDLGTMTKAARQMPAIKTGWILKHHRLWPFSLVVTCARHCGLSVLDLQSDWPLHRDEVNQAHAAGLEIHLWTVDDPVRARELTELGVNGLTTNRPGRLRRELAAD